TLAVFTRRFKVEGSVFNGAHPDEVRTDLDPVRLDAYGGRLSFNPSAGSSLTAWFGHIPASGGAHAHDALDRFGGSFLHTRPLAGSGEWCTALVYGGDLPAGGRPPLDSLFFGSRMPVGVLVYLELRPALAAHGHVMPR